MSGVEDHGNTTSQHHEFFLSGTGLRSGLDSDEEDGETPGSGVVRYSGEIEPMEELSASRVGVS